MKKTILTIAVAVVMQLSYAEGIHPPDSDLTILDNAGNVEKVKILNSFSQYYSDKVPQKAIHYALQALQHSEQAGIPAGQAEAMFYLGTAYYQLNAYNEATQWLVRARQMYQQIDDDHGVAGCLNRLGNTQQLKTNYVEALRYYREALVLNEEINDKSEIARSLTNIGSIHQLFGNYREAIDYQIRSLNIYEEMNNHEGLAWSYLNLARLFKKLSEYKKALDYVNKSFVLYDEISNSGGSKTGVTLCLKETGSIYQEMGDLGKALEYSNKVLELNIAARNNHGIANTLGTIGQIYFNRKEYEKGLENLLHATEKKVKLNDSTDLPVLYRYLGLTYLQLKDYPRATDYLFKALSLAQEQSLKNEVMDAYKSLATLSFAQGKMKEAYGYQIQYIAMKDSLNVKEITEKEMQNEFSKKEKQMELESAVQEVRLQRQKIIIWFSVTCMLGVLLLAISIYRNYNAKKKANRQLALQNEEIREQRDHIVHQNQLITDSIHYAVRIQRALLPRPGFIQEAIGNHFIFFLPRDIVSGDFYWVSKKENIVFVAVADCTGHGVPGAFMSMLGVAFLNEIVNRKNISVPGEILNQLRSSIIDALHQSDKNTETKDGMDIALVAIDRANEMLKFSGAHNSCYLFHNGIANEIKAHKMPIGVHYDNDFDDFTTQQIPVKKGDKVYLFTDGYADQFGGDKNMKFKQKNLRDLFMTIQDIPMAEQRNVLEKTFFSWKRNYPQVDDILVMGICI